SEISREHAQRGLHRGRDVAAEPLSPCGRGDAVPSQRRLLDPRRASTWRPVCPSHLEAIDYLRCRIDQVTAVVRISQPCATRHCVSQASMASSTAGRTTQLWRVVMKRKMESKAQQSVVQKDARRERKHQANPKRGRALEVRRGGRRSPLAQTTRDKEKAALK